MSETPNKGLRAAAERVVAAFDSEREWTAQEQGREEGLALDELADALAADKTTKGAPCNEN